MGQAIVCLVQVWCWVFGAERLSSGCTCGLLLQPTVSILLPGDVMMVFRPLIFFLLHTVQSVIVWLSHVPAHMHRHANPNGITA